MNKAFKNLENKTEEEVKRFVQGVMNSKNNDLIYEFFTDCPQYGKYLTSEQLRLYTINRASSYVDIAIAEALQNVYVQLDDEFVNRLAHVQEVAVILVSSNQGGHMRFAQMNDNLKTPEVCYAALLQYVGAIKDIPERHLTENMCKHAVETDGRLIKHIPEKMRTRHVFCEAIKKYPEAFNLMPESMKDEYTYIILARSIRPNSNIKFPEVQDEALIGTAIEKNPHNICHFKKISQHLAEKVMNMDESTYCYKCVQEHY